MSSNASKYSQNYIQKEVIDYLEKDGALCDYYSKYYKEKETYDGGVGDRQAFKNYNDKITKYQNILKILTGERRANIYESIPAIDFTNPNFTGFYYTYDIYTDSTTGQTIINNNEIVPIPKTEDKLAIDLIEEEDGYTINRALMGESIAEHFYNTTSLTSSSYDLQVSPYILEEGKYEYIYCGVLSPKTFKNGVYTDDIRVTDLLYYPVTSATSMYFNDDTPRMSGVFAEDGSGYLVDVLQSDETLNGSLRITKNIVLNVDCGWTPYDENYNRITGYKTSIKHNDSVEFPDVPIVTAMENENSVEYQYFGHYQLNLDSGDFIVAIPANAYTLSSTKLIIFKRNNSDSNETVTSSYEKAYFNSYTTRFYEDSSFSVAVNPLSEKYKDKYIVAIGNETENGVYKYNNLTTSYIRIDVESIDTSAKTVTLKKIKNPYTCYILYIKGFNKDINSFDASGSYDPSALFTKVSAGDKMPDVLMEEFIYSKLYDYISVEVNYLAGASGLLSGYFSTPYTYTESANASNVTKWSFINERQTALEGGMDIDIGSKYFTGHLLNRGGIIASPLMLTSNDSLDNKSYTDLIADGIQGKATLYLKKLLSLGNIYDKVFKKYCVEDNAVFYKKRRTIGKAITSDNFKDGTLLFKDRFRRNNSESPVDLEDIYNFFRTWKTLLNGTTLTIDLDTTAVKYQSAMRKTEGAGIFISGSTNVSGSSMDDFYKVRNEIKRETIETGSPSIIAFYYISKQTSYWWGNGNYTRFNEMYTSIFTPWDLFRCKNKSNTNIIVFPSEKKYFPEEVVILSTKDLGLTKDKPCFLHNNGRLLGFYVKDIISILPSKIQTIDIKQDGQIIDRFNVESSGSTKSGTHKYFSRIQLLDDFYEEAKGNSNYADSWEYLFKGNKDCYIYKLSCLNCSDLQKGLTFYDANNEPVVMSGLSSYSKFLPLSYATTSSQRLFKGKKIMSDDSDSCIYSVYPESRGDFAKLEGFDIMCGVPKYTYTDTCKLAEPSSTKSENFGRLQIRGLFGFSNFAPKFLATFADMINNAQAFPQDILSGMLKDLLSNWKMSTSTTNPILLKDIPQIFDGLLQFSKELHDLTDTGITVESKGRLVTLSRGDFKKLIRLIDNGSNIRKYQFNIVPPSDLTTVDTSSGLTNACNSYMSSQLNKAVVGICNPNGSSWETESGKEYYNKSSIYSLDNVFNNIFVSSESLSNVSEMEGLCNQLDHYFGNDTQAFLSIGESYTASGEKVDKGPSLETFREQIINSMAKVVTNVVTTVLKSDNPVEKAFNELKANYKNYYTSESVEDGISLQNNSVSIDWYKLIPLKDKKSLILDAYEKADRTLFFPSIVFSKTRIF